MKILELLIEIKYNIISYVLKNNILHNNFEDNNYSSIYEPKNPNIQSHISEDNKHRIINDAGTSSTELWSASKIDTELSSKADLVGGLIPQSQLPSYVDDVLEYSNFASLPLNGESGKLYTTLELSLNEPEP